MVTDNAPQQPKQSTVLLHRKIIITKLANFTSLGEFGRPRGLWRALPRCLWDWYPALHKDAVFAYCSDRNRLEAFVDSVRGETDANSLLPSAADDGLYSFEGKPRGYFALFNGLMWMTNHWIGDDGQFPVFTFHGLWDLSDSYYLGWIEDKDTSPENLELSLPLDASFPSNSIFCYQQLPYLELFCSDFLHCRQLENSGGFRSPISFGGGRAGRLNGDRCPTCFGVHREACPASAHQPVAIEGARKYLQFSSEVLDRRKLAEAVIGSLQDNHFLLIQSPPCSGKTTFLRRVGLAILEKNPHCSLQFATAHKSRTLQTNIFCGLEKPITTSADFLAHISNPDFRKPFYLIIDEAQNTYTESNWWEQLYSSPPYDDVFVIAAGSYGSHSDSLSHSPPRDIPVHLRMSLFHMNDRPFFLAFNMQDLTSYMQSRSIPLNWKGDIIKYASPTAPTGTVMTRTTSCMGLHPGVIRSLVDFLHEQLQKQKEVKDLLDAFRRSSLHNALNPYPRDLSRCVPRKPLHGFTSLWVLMFSSVLLNGCIIVPKIARGVPDIVVVNRHGSVHEPDCPLIQSVTQSDHLLIGNNVYNFPHNIFTFAELDHVRKYVKETQIATTPRDRFFAVDAGEMIADPALPFKPYSSRQMTASNSPLDSFQQAAHDARQMGWLLETSMAEYDLSENEIMLVMPSRWHLDYLKSLLEPEPLTPLAQTATLDDFILAVLKEFNGSVLTEPLAEGPSIRERVYEIEFHRCAEKLAGARFLTPQAYKPRGEGFEAGYADFVVRSREWVIELLRDSKNLDDHLKRVGERGKYTAQWPNYESRVVNFCIHHSDKQVDDDPKHIYVGIKVLGPGAMRHISMQVSRASQLLAVFALTNTR